MGEEGTSGSGTFFFSLPDGLYDTYRCNTISSTVTETTCTQKENTLLCSENRDHAGVVGYLSKTLAFFFFLPSIEAFWVPQVR